MNATSRPKAPRRGSSSISSVPSAASRRHVVDLERDVVHARASRGEELPDRRLRAERAEQLDAAAADAHRHGLDALIGDRLPLLELGTEQTLVARDGLVEVGDRDAEMVDAGRGHRARC